MCSTDRDDTCEDIWSIFGISSRILGSSRIFDPTQHFPGFGSDDLFGAPKPTDPERFLENRSSSTDTWGNVHWQCELSLKFRLFRMNWKEIVGSNCSNAVAEAQRWFNFRDGLQNAARTGAPLTLSYIDSLWQCAVDGFQAVAKRLPRAWYQKHSQVTSRVDCLQVPVETETEVQVPGSEQGVFVSANICGEEEELHWMNKTLNKVLSKTSFLQPALHAET